MTTKTQLNKLLELHSIYENALVNIATNSSHIYPVSQEELVTIATNALLQKKNFISEVKK